MTDLPQYDFENDNTISERRKEACRLPYQEMQPQHLDKIFTSAYVYDKKTGEPIAKKPRSLHELVWAILQSSMAITEKMLSQEERLETLEKEVNQLKGLISV